jgi:glutamate-1-semialdehyde 2,1-aminomutase
MAAGLATLDEMTPARYERLEALGGELRRKLEELGGVDVRQTASLFQVDVGDEQRQLDLNLALLANGILSTPRGMGCLSTPMTSAEIDAFVDAVRLALG